MLWSRSDQRRCRWGSGVVGRGEGRKEGWMDGWMDGDRRGRDKGMDGWIERNKRRRAGERKEREGGEKGRGKERR